MRHHQELEAELGENKQAQARLRQELEQVQKQLQALRTNQGSEQKQFGILNLELLLERSCFWVWSAP